MSFHTQTFANRHNAMGDQAEEAFDRVYGDRVHIPGLNRYWKNGKRLSLNKMTLEMRYTPDRMIDDRWVEVMGIGRDQTLKIKYEKLSALKSWTMMGPVDLFVYDSYKDRYWQADLNDWWNACITDGTGDTFPEGKQYVRLHARSFPTEPMEMPT